MDHQSYSQDRTRAGCRPGFFWGLLAIAGLMGVTTAVATAGEDNCIPPPSGLVNWWTGDTDASDFQAGNDGVLMNDALAGVPGKVNGAFGFDGMDDFVSFGNTIGNFGTSDFTIDFWIKTSSTRNEAILGKRPICNHASFWDIRIDGTGELRIALDQDDLATNFNS
ncbi:MAG: hypothetical protein V3T70_00145, partial [Phycisphaerae bacterium]